MDIVDMEHWTKTMRAYAEAIEARDWAIVEAILNGETYGAVGRQFLRSQAPYGPMAASAVKMILLRFVHRRARAGEEPFVALSKILPMITRRKLPRVVLNRAGHRTDAIERARAVWKKHRTKMSGEKDHVNIVSVPNAEGLRRLALLESAEEPSVVDAVVTDKVDLPQSPDATNPDGSVRSSWQKIVGGS